MREHTVSYTDKDDTHFIGCSGVPGHRLRGASWPGRCRSARAPKPFTLTASVMPQNLGAADEVTADVTPPAVPTASTVIDNRSCSDKLRVRWNPGTDPDLAGYILFYGATGSFTVPLRAIDRNDPRVTLNPANLLVTKCADRTAAPNTYAIQVAAYDSSGNNSAKSAAVSGNPSPDVTSFTASPFSNDTTVNPGKPAAADGVDRRARAADGELVVSWRPPADAATAGYRLYRSTAAFGSGHIDGSLQIRDEAALTAAVTTWTDTNLERCSTYYYAVASVNCDETLVDLLPVHGQRRRLRRGEQRMAGVPCRRRRPASRARSRSSSRSSSR